MKITANLIILGVVKQHLVQSSRIDGPTEHVSQILTATKSQVEIQVMALRVTLIKNNPPVGPCSRLMPRGPYGGARGWAYERSTQVEIQVMALRVTPRTASPPPPYL